MSGSIRDKDCTTRTLSAGAAGVVLGGLAGAVTATWQDVPKVIRNQSWPAFVATGMASINLIEEYARQNWICSRRNSLLWGLTPYIRF